jgi:hypothetical protein
MRRSAAIVTSSVVLLAPLAAAADPVDSVCVRGSAPVLLDESSTARLHMYTATVDATTFSEERIDTPAYSDFIAYLEEVNLTADVDVFDQRALLERQRDVFIEFLGPEAGVDHQRLLDGAIGQLGEVTCVQSILFDLQNERWPLSDGPVEMGALLLQRQVAGAVELRAYVKTQAQQQFVGLSMSELMPLVEADVAGGWQLLSHMHSHPLSPDGQYDIAGTVLPSDPDIRTYRSLRDELGLQEAWITNGVDSARYRADEFDDL